MTSIGRKIFSAFVEINNKDVMAVPVEQTAVNTVKVEYSQPVESSKFKQHFEKLFKEANIPGPDYYEFSKMTEAMQSIMDEKARYSAAFAGLNVQGLDKQKLLATAVEYVQLLDADATRFEAIVDAALEDKVQAKQKEVEDKKNRIQSLSQEINNLQQQIETLQKEIAENEEKIRSSTGGYKAEKENLKTKVLQDIEKIKQHII